MSQATPAEGPGRSRLHRVPTPEGLLLPFQVATAGDRVLAFAVDAAILVAGTVAVWLLAALTLFGGIGELGLPAALLASFFLRHGYFIYWEARRGMTVGKRLLGLRVISRDGGPLTVEAAFARNLVRDLELFLPLTALADPRALVPGAPDRGLLAAILWLLVFALMPLFNADRLRCGDLVAGTLVVKAPAVVLLSDLAAPPRWPAARAESPAEPAFSREQLDIYGIHELQVLEDLLRRYAEGRQDPRVLEEVAVRIKKKIGWPRERWDEPALPFLEAFYRAQRGRLEQKLLFGQRQERKAQGPG